MTDDLPWEWLGLLAVAVAVASACGVAKENWFDASDETGLLVAARDVPAFTRLSSGDVEVAEGISAAEAQQTMTETIGRVTGKPLDQGAPLLGSFLLELSAAPADDWLVLFVAHPSAPKLEIGEKVTLVGAESGEGAEPRVVSRQAIVLGQQAGFIVVAMPPDEAAAAAGFLHPEAQLVVLRQLTKEPSD